MVRVPGGRPIESRPPPTEWKSPPMSQDPADPKSPALDPRIQAHLGDQLRRLYADMLAEPVPDRFKTLLDQLERVEPPAAPPKEGPR